MFEQALKHKQVLAPSYAEWAGYRCSPASYILPSTRTFISQRHHFTYSACRKSKHTKKSQRFKNIIINS